MSIIAYAGETIKGRDGKIIATLAEDIHSGDLNLRPNQFTMAEGHELTGGFLPEEIHQYLRDRLSSPSPAPKAAPKAKASPATKTKAKAKPAAQPAAKPLVQSNQGAIGQIDTVSGSAKGRT